MDTLLLKKHRYLFISLIITIVISAFIIISVYTSVTIEVEGKTIKTHAWVFNSVRDVLQKEKIKWGETDIVTPSLSCQIGKDMSINVIRGCKVEITADGQCQEIVVPPGTVEETLAAAGLELGEKDIVTPGLMESVAPQQKIEIIRVTEEIKEIESPISYGVEVKNDNKLEKGLYKVINPGKTGVAVNTVKITYHNGKEAHKEILSSKTLIEPENKVIAMGTITVASRGNINFDFKEVKYMESTAYTYTGRRTATGREPAVGIVAVDPSIIPLGTKLYIEGYGYAQAADTGGSVKGNIIDVFLEERAQCIKWGRRMVKVYILN